MSWDRGRQNELAGDANPMHLTRGGEEGRTGDMSSVLAMPLMLYAQHTDTQRQTAKRSTLLSIKALKILKELHKVKRRFLLFRCYKGFYFYIPKCSWCGRHAVILRLTLCLRRSPADMSLPLEATLPPCLQWRWVSAVWTAVSQCVHSPPASLPLISSRS